MTLKSFIYRKSCGFTNYSLGLAYALGIFSRAHPIRVVKFRFWYGEQIILGMLRINHRSDIYVKKKMKKNRTICLQQGQTCGSI